MFIKGHLNGFNGSTPMGGQIPPMKILGLKLEWKKAQKKPKKIINSDIINKIIPVNILNWTTVVNILFEKNSYLRSLTQRDEKKNISNSPNQMKKLAPKWKYLTRPRAKKRTPKAIWLGHIDGETIKKGWLFLKYKEDLFIFSGITFLNLKSESNILRIKSGEFIDCFIIYN